MTQTPAASTGARGNVVSVRGGAVHLPAPGMPGTYPLCRTGAQDSGRTRYTLTSGPVTCKTCLVYQARLAARAAAQAATPGA